MCNYPYVTITALVVLLLSSASDYSSLFMHAVVEEMNGGHLMFHSVHLEAAYKLIWKYFSNTIHTWLYTCKCHIASYHINRILEKKVLSEI